MNTIHAVKLYQKKLKALRSTALWMTVTAGEGSVNV